MFKWWHSSKHVKNYFKNFANFFIEDLDISKTVHKIVKTAWISCSKIVLMFSKIQKFHWWLSNSAMNISKKQNFTILQNTVTIFCIKAKVLKFIQSTISQLKNIPKLAIIISYIKIKFWFSQNQILGKKNDIIRIGHGSQTYSYIYYTNKKKICKIYLWMYGWCNINHCIRTLRHHNPDSKP